MSYRAFKKLLGETSLERKCRWLLGAGVLLLMTGSFWVYAQQTETLAYEQLDTTGRVLIAPIFAKEHIAGEVAKDKELSEANWPAQVQGYGMIVPGSNDPARKPQPDDLAILDRFLNDAQKKEESRQSQKEKSYYYYGAIRASQACIDCHASEERMEKEKKGAGEKADEDLQVGQLMSLVRVRLSTQAIEDGFHTNRAVLISFAIGTSLLIIAGSYLIIRYVIVKPVKHLKEVSEAIASGELNIRSEIQTGDEFEDLSHAFNR